MRTHATSNKEILARTSRRRTERGGPLRDLAHTNSEADGAVSEEARTDERDGRVAAEDRLRAAVASDGGLPVPDAQLPRPDRREQPAVG